MTTLKEMPVDEAPRDFVQLNKLGKFQLRTLAKNLGLLEDETAKMNFITSPQEQQAQSVCEALKEYDKTKAAGPVPTSPAPAAEKPKRQPRTTDDKAAAAAPSGMDMSEVLKAIEASEKRIASLIEALTNLVAASMTLTLVAAEENLGAGRADIIEQVLEDVPSTLKMVTAKKK